MIESTLSSAISLYESATRHKVFSIRLLTGGTANDIYLINLNTVLRFRLPNITEEPFYSALSEIAVLRALPTTIAPELYAYDSNRGHLLLRYIPEDTIDERKDATFRLYRSLIRTVKLLHGCTIKPDFPPFAPLVRYEHYKKLSETSFDEAYETKVIERASLALSRSPQVLCHNDLHRRNFLYESRTDSVRLIDFEEAGINAEVFDIASILCENEIDQRTKERLINYYYGVNQVTTSLLEDIDAVMAFQDLLWYYWAEARYKETIRQNYLDIAKSKMAHIRKAMRAAKGK